ncbi:hypothetical protein HK098_005712 [Nowakowskiella sp. JEL0407]|nr:hypothetical protein HK098_005712 [Nowakowskiella sp. JEL0407]
MYDSVISEFESLRKSNFGMSEALKRNYLASLIRTSQITDAKLVLSTLRQPWKESTFNLFLELASLTPYPLAKILNLEYFKEFDFKEFEYFAPAVMRAVNTNSIVVTLPYLLEMGGYKDYVNAKNCVVLSLCSVGDFKNLEELLGYEYEGKTLPMEICSRAVFRPYKKLVLRNRFWNAAKSRGMLPPEGLIDKQEAQKAVQDSMTIMKILKPNLPKRSGVDYGYVFANLVMCAVGVGCEEMVKEIVEMFKSFKEARLTERDFGVLEMVFEGQFNEVLEILRPFVEKER